MPIYQFSSGEYVYYEHFIRADTEEEAIEYFNNDVEGWSDNIVDGNHFEIEVIQEVNEEDAFFPILDTKEKNND